ncbi:hypothetical protein [Pedobacter glucosidilyticus]|uniref:hypothetical protein n=1 Tax=Pedobacter glucosidilyticus TaxID=1122941 RepID=UPI0026F1D85C|nr:hypothetical protein [Pedobacter glucosidilyticus]
MKYYGITFDSYKLYPQFMKDMNQEPIHLKIRLDGEETQLNAKKEETTDGISFFKIEQQGKLITQIRKIDNKWEQLWGDLNQQQIDEIGTALDREED